MSKRAILIIVFFQLFSNLEASTLMNYGKRSENTKYKLILTGDLKDVLNAEESAQQTDIANGSFGLTRLSKKYDLSILIKLVDSKQPTEFYFANDLLNPSGQERTSGAIDFAWHLFTVPKPQKANLKERFIDFCDRHTISLRIFGTISTNLWKIADPILVSPLLVSPLGIQSTIISSSIGISSNLFEDSWNNHMKFNSNIFLGLATRHFSGDIALESNKNIRKSILGEDKLGYYGFQVFVDLNINNVRGFVDTTYFQGDIGGFSKWRVTVGIGIQADLFMIDVNSPSNPNNPG